MTYRMFDYVTCSSDLMNFVSVCNPPSNWVVRNTSPYTIANAR